MFVTQKLWKSYRIHTHLPGAPCCRDINILHLRFLFWRETTNRRQRQNRNGSCCLGKPATIYDFWMFIWKSRGLVPLPRAIGVCIIPCEKAWHWLHHEIDPHIFMLRNRISQEKNTVCVLISFTSNEIQVRKVSGKQSVAGGCHEGEWTPANIMKSRVPVLQVLQSTCRSRFSWKQNIEWTSPF